MHLEDNVFGNCNLQRLLRCGIVFLWTFTIFALSLSYLSDRSRDVSLFAQGNDWFDSWALQGKSERELRKSCENQAELFIDNLKQTVQLTEPQANKIRLAAQGDIHRFFIKVAEARYKTRNMQPNNQQVNEISRIIAPIQQVVQKGLLNEESLFESTVNQVLDDQQLELWKAAKEKHIESLYRAILQLQLVQLENHMPLLAKQREKLIDLTLTRLKGKRVDMQYRFYLIEYAMYGIPKDTLNSFLDEPQVVFFQKRGAQAMGWKSMLESAGVKWDDEAKEKPAENNREQGDPQGNADPNNKKEDANEKKKGEDTEPQKKADPASGAIS
ncbi:MAG: hypothetical protein RLY14_677 [Planctomycetota bacterium]|jgi:hypothetical protein